MTGILFGGLLIGIPVIIHLLHRQKVTPISWGAMQFLLETPLKVRRRRRIDNWLLMLLRMAILLLLVAVLARPVISSARLVSTTPMDVAVVLDHSLSMGRRNPGGGATLFEEGIGTVERLSKMLPESATLSVVLAEHAPHAVTAQPVRLGPMNRAPDGTPAGAWSQALQQMRRLKPGLTEARIAEAVRAAQEQLDLGNNTRKMLLIISDEQRSNWSIGEEAAWRPMDSKVGERSGSTWIYNLPVRGQGAEGAGNVSVKAITVQPAYLGVHRPAQITATVSNTGAVDMRDITMQLVPDGKTAASQSLPLLAPGESKTVRFEHFFAEPGGHWVRIRADVQDALEADNAATAGVTVWPRLPVLVVDGQLTVEGSFPQSAFLLAAMQPVDASIDPGTLILPTVVSVGQLGPAAGGRAVRPEDYPVIVLNDVPRLPREIVQQLSDHVQAGNGLWIILGPRTEQDFVNGTLAKSALFPARVKPVAHAAGGGGAAAPPTIGLEIKEKDDPIVAALAELRGLAGVSLRAWWPLTEAARDMWPVVATTDGDPLITDMEAGKAGGRVVVWTTSVADVGWTNLPLMGGSFVPLVHETLFRLASGQGASQPRQLETGQPLVWMGPSKPEIDSATLVLPSGATRPLNPQLRGDRYVITERETYEPGLYELRFAAPPRPGAAALPPVYFSVNLSPAELDPEVLAPGDLDWLKGRAYLRDSLTLETLPAALEAQPGGVDIWWALGLALTALLVTEVLVTRRLARQQSGADVDRTGLTGLPAVGGPGAPRTGGAA